MQEEMTKERLAQLFPIILESHNPKWKKYYLQEKEFLQTIFGDSIVRINHIGSTYVDGLMAKPTIDILIEVCDNVNIEPITEKLSSKGYIKNEAHNDIITYIKGYTSHGFEGQAVHIHVRHSGDWGELYFRDYLILHPTAAREYEKLKIELRGKFLHDRDGYTEGKSKFVNENTEKARVELSNKYNPAV